MTLKVEVVVDGRVHTEEALGGTSQALHFALSSSDHQVRVLGPIVLPKSLFMVARVVSLEVV
jgi:hypothetical protein